MSDMWKSDCIRCKLPPIFVVIFSARIDIRSQLSDGERHFLVTGASWNIRDRALLFTKNYSWINLPPLGSSDSDIAWTNERDCESRYSWIIRRSRNNRRIFLLALLVIDNRSKIVFYAIDQLADVLITLRQTLCRTRDGKMAISLLEPFIQFII